MKRTVKHTGRVLAVAAFVVVGAAHAYEWQINEDTTFGIAGEVEVDYVIEDAGERNSIQEMEGEGTIEFFGEHTLTDRLDAYFAAEFEYNFVESGDAFDIDEAIFGVKGDFGAVQVGTWDGIYDEYIEDTMDIFDVGEPTHAPITGGDQSIAYFSPSFNGFAFAVQAILRGEDNIATSDDGQAFQAVAGYENEQFSIFLGYDSRGLIEDAEGTLGLSGVARLEPFTLSARIAKGGGIDGVTDGYMVYGVTASYEYKQFGITGAVNQVAPEDDNKDGRTEIGVNVSYAIADNFNIYAEHFMYDRENDLGNVTAVGLNYEF